MDNTGVSVFVLYISLFVFVAKAYDFIDAPFELNKLEAVASFPDSGRTVVQKVTESQVQPQLAQQAQLKESSKKNGDTESGPHRKYIVTTTASPVEQDMEQDMEMHGRQAPISTTPSPVDDFHFSDDSFFPFDRFQQSHEQQQQSREDLMSEDKFITPQERIEMINSRNNNHQDSYETSKVDGYIMVDGKMQRFSRATARHNGRPVADTESVLKPVTLFVPQPNNKQHDLKAVHGYVIGRQGSLGETQRPNQNIEERSLPREYTLFFYPGKKYENNYGNSIHAPFTTSPPVSNVHPLNNNGKSYQPILFANEVRQREDYRIPTGEQEIFMVKPQGQNYQAPTTFLNSYDPKNHNYDTSQLHIEGRQSAYYEQPKYYENRDYNEGDYRRGNQYDEERRQEQNYDRREPRYQTNSQSYSDSQNYESPSYYPDSQSNYDRGNQANYDRQETYDRGNQANYDRQETYDRDNRPYREEAQPSYRDRQESYDQEPTQRQQGQSQPSSPTGAQTGKNQGTFIQHGPPITRFIPYLNLNGNLVPKFKNGRYHGPSFDVSDAKKAKVPRKTAFIFGRGIPIAYSMSGKTISIVCPRVTDSFCQKAGHFSHPTHSSCFVQCDERKVAFVKTCPKNTEWRQVTKSCV